MDPSINHRCQICIYVYYCILCVFLLLFLFYFTVICQSLFSTLFRGLIFDHVEKHLADQKCLTAMTQMTVN